MSYKPGQKVKLKYTGEIAEVISQPEMGIVQVLLLEAGIKIPVNTEDLTGIEEAGTIIDKKGKPVMPVAVQEARDHNIHFPKSSLTNTGLQIAFTPQHNKIGEILHFEVHLINDSKDDVLFQAGFREVPGMEAIDGVLKSTSAYYLGKIERDFVEFNKVYVLRIARILTSGVEEYISQTVKLKPKTFFSKEDFAPLLDRLSYVLKYSPDTKVDNDTSGLKEITRQQIASNLKEETGNYYMPFADPIRLSEFSNELDLHVEALMPGKAKLPQDQLFHLQLSVFDKYLADAIRLGMERVFIIHGIGSGRLKNAIAKRLDMNPYVRDYKNEFHAAYGFGATEVILD